MDGGVVKNCGGWERNRQTDRENEKEMERERYIGLGYIYKCIQQGINKQLIQK